MKIPFDLQQLQCFVMLADTLHFGQAAQRLHMTQSPLSRQIALLEERLEVKLFIRHNRAVSLTPAGIYLLQEARSILARAAEAAINTQLAAQGEQGTLVIGFTSSASFELLPRLVQLHHRKYPGINFVFKELLIEEQIRMLRATTLDVALARPPIDGDLFDSYLVMRDRWVLAMPSDHSLTALEQVPLHHLNGVSMIAWSPYSQYFFQMLDKLFKAHDVSPHTIASVPQITAMLGMVRLGIGLAIVPHAVASHAIDGITMRPLLIDPTHMQAPELQTLLLWRRNEHNAIVHRFVETVKQSEAIS